MSLYPGARVRLLPDAHRQPSITPAMIIDHTQAGSGSLYGWWTNPGSGGLECHLWVGLDGAVEQYVDTHRSADANYKANRWTEAGRAYGAISIETENSRAATNAAYRGGKGAAAFDADPWTPAQLDALEDLHDWLADEHPEIRRQRANAPTVGGRGLGYHSMWGTGPTAWIPYSSRGKTCPGRERIRQWNDRLLPAFVRSTSRPTPTPTPKPGGLTVSEAKAINKRLNGTNAVVAELGNAIRRTDAAIDKRLDKMPHRPVLLRSEDGRVWVITPFGRYHLRNQDHQAVNLLAFFGQIEPPKGEIPTLPDTQMRHIPIVDLSERTP